MVGPGGTFLSEAASQITLGIRDQEQPPRGAGAEGLPPKGEAGYQGLRPVEKHR